LDYLSSEIEQNQITEVSLENQTFNLLFPIAKAGMEELPGGRPDDS